MGWWLEDCADWIEARTPRSVLAYAEEQRSIWWIWWRVNRVGRAIIFGSILFAILLAVLWRWKAY